MVDEPGANNLIYVGTYTTWQHAPLRSVGIYAYRLDPSSGALTLANKLSKVSNPSFLVLDRPRRFLYAVNEIEKLNGKTGGGVSALAIDPASGALRFLNQQPSHGVHPCHLCLDRTGRFVLVANYSSGSVAMFPVEADGTIGPAADVVQHQGSSVNSERQEGPHAHSVTVDPANRYALVADLGLDRVVVYRLDLEHRKLIPTSHVSTAPGAGPRHVDFHPNGRYVYVINELSSTLTAFAYDAPSGALHEIQTLSTLPDGFAGESTCADVHVTPSGQFVYGSNRGHDSIAGFAIDSTTGRLTRLGWTATQGKTPRNFAIDPTGNLLLAANQDSCTIAAFRINGETGDLAPLGAPTSVPTPVCIKFA
jgi:6-phosphogluconolactonase